MWLSHLRRWRFAPQLRPIAVPMKKLLLFLAALAAASFTFAVETAKAPAVEKPKADAKCDDGSCCDDEKPADAKGAKVTGPKTDAVKKDAAKPVEKK